MFDNLSPAACDDKHPDRDDQWAFHHKKEEPAPCDDIAHESSWPGVVLCHAAMVKHYTGMAGSCVHQDGA